MYSFIHSNAHILQPNDVNSCAFQPNQTHPCTLFVQNPSIHFSQLRSFTWFVPNSYSQIEPTNNKGEQSLREMVVIKKIIRTLRNQNGADVLAKMMTLISTWRLNGLNPFYSLRAII